MHAKGVLAVLNFRVHVQLKVLVVGHVYAELTTLSMHTISYAVLYFCTV